MVLAFIVLALMSILIVRQTLQMRLVFPLAAIQRHSPPWLSYGCSRRHPILFTIACLHITCRRCTACCPHFIRFVFMSVIRRFVQRFETLRRLTKCIRAPTISGGIGWIQSKNIDSCCVLSLRALCNRSTRISQFWWLYFCSGIFSSFVNVTDKYYVYVDKKITTALSIRLNCTTPKSETEIVFFFFRTIAIKCVRVIETMTAHQWLQRSTQRSKR